MICVHKMPVTGGRRLGSRVIVISSYLLSIFFKRFESWGGVQRTWFDFERIPDIGWWLLSQLKGGGNTCEVSGDVIKEKYFWNLEFPISAAPLVVHCWARLSELRWWSTRWSRQRANDKYKDHLDGKITAPLVNNRNEEKSCSESFFAAWGDKVLYQIKNKSKLF